MKTRAAIAALSLAAVSTIGIVAAHADYPEDCAGFQTQHSLTSGVDIKSYDHDDQCVDALGGNDNITFAGGTNTAWGDGGGDTLYGQGGQDNFSGGASPDILTGNGNADLLSGNDGDDTIYDGLNPNGQGDAIFGGDGQDTLRHCTGAGSNSGDDFIANDVETVNNSPNWC